MMYNTGTLVLSMLMMMMMLREKLQKIEFECRITKQGSLLFSGDTGCRVIIHNRNEVTE